MRAIHEHAEPGHQDPYRLPRINPTRTMSGNANLDRSKRHEREIVHTAEDHDWRGERAYASNGKSLSEHRECDVRLTAPDGTELTVQAKRRKNVASYLTCENTDLVVTREDRGENLAVIPLSMLLDLLSEGQ